MLVNPSCSNELRMIQGTMVSAKASAISRAARFCLTRNHAHKTASPVKGRMTERVSAVSPRNRPESKKREVVGFSIDERRRRKEERSKTKKGFSVPRPRG